MNSKERNMKFIFITGGVISSLGKGLVASSLGLLLKSRGFSVNIVKIDPYLQVDAGTMSPFEHGEVFVTEDGGETDLDIGNYERFLDANLSSKNSITTGRIYWSVLSKERKGLYLGKTVQVIPHITDEVKCMLRELAEGYDVTIVEVGGTVGDIEGQPFLEAIRQMKKDLGKKNTLYVHVSLLPFLRTTNEIKTKPTQHSVKELRSIGIQPDILIVRTEIPVSEKIKEKLALFCDVEKEAVIEALDVRNIYEIPLILEKQNLDSIAVKMLELEERSKDLSLWKEIVDRIENPKMEVNIGIVGKYVELKDSYKSLIEALTHAGVNNQCKVNIKWVNAENLENPYFYDIINGEVKSARLSGILIPGGFGERGIEGMINAIKYVREKNVPFLGLCLGLQCAVIEFARNVCGLKDANSTEFNPNTPYPVIDLMPDQKKISEKGGTMRVGAFTAILKDGSLVSKLYDSKEVRERHRHRYEVNTDFVNTLEKNGLSISGTSPNGRLVEFVENTSCNFFVATQAHPEFKSHPGKPHPLFDGFIKACIKNKEI